MYIQIRIKTCISPPEHLRTIKSVTACFYDVNKNIISLKPIHLFQKASRHRIPQTAVDLIFAWVGDDAIRVKGMNVWDSFLQKVEKLLKSGLSCPL